MAVAEELKIVLRAETAAAVRALRKAQQQTNTNEASLKRLSGQLVRTVAGYAAMGVSLRAVIRFSRESIQAAMEQERAESSLAAAIMVTGKESEISAEAIHRLASELQDVTTFGDEATISAAAMTQQLANLSQHQLMQIIPQIQNFAAAMGMDLNSAAQLIGKSIGSSTNALTRYGVEIDNSLRGNQRYTAILESLSGKFDGFAETVAFTASGSMAQLRNAIGDSKEQIGDFLLTALNPAVRALTSMFQTINDNASGPTISEALIGTNGSAELEQVNAKLEEQRRILREQGMESRSAMAGEARMAIAELEHDKQRILNAQKRREVLDGLQRQAANASAATKAEQERITDINAVYLSQLGGIEKQYNDTTDATRILVNEGIMPAEEGTRRIATAARMAAEAIARIKFDPAMTGETKAQGTRLLRQFVPDPEENKEFVASLGARGAALWTGGWRQQFRAEQLSIEYQDMLLQMEDASEGSAERVANNWVGAFNVIGGSAMQTFAMMNQLSQQTSQRRIARINDTLKAELDANRAAMSDLQKRHDQEIAWAEATGASSEELARIKAEQLEEQHAHERELEEQAAQAEAIADAKKKDLAQKQFRRDQALQYGNVLMATATGVMQAYAQLGPIAGKIAAGFVLAAGGVQAGVIKNQKVPAYARGGEFTTSGPQMIMVGDNPGGRERVRIDPQPDGRGSASTIINNYITVRAVAGSDKETIAAWVADGIKRGQERGTIGAVA